MLSPLTCDRFSCTIRPDHIPCRDQSQNEALMTKEDPEWCLAIQGTRVEEAFQPVQPAGIREGIGIRPGGLGGGHRRGFDMESETLSIYFVCHTMGF